MTKKQTTIIFVSVILMLIFCIYYAMMIRTESVAAVAARFANNNTITPNDFTEIDTLYNKTMLINLGVLSIIQIINLGLFMLKNNKALLVMLLVEIILAIVTLIVYSNGEFIIFTLPIINSLLYLFGSKDKDKIKE